ncbi:hypothetical protein ACQ4PT_031937 [Festuca glaucescens]
MVWLRVEDEAKSFGIELTLTVGCRWRVDARGQDKLCPVNGGSRSVSLCLSHAYESSGELCRRLPQSLACAQGASTVDSPNSDALPPSRSSISRPTDTLPPPATSRCAGTPRLDPPRRSPLAGLVPGSRAPLSHKISPTMNGQSRKQRILIVPDFFFPNFGGVESHIYYLSQCLLKLGHKVVVMTHAYGSRSGVRYVTGGLKVYYVPWWPFLMQNTLPTLFMTFPI